MDTQYLEIGKIVNVHGLKGEVKVVPWCDSVAFLCSFTELYLGKDKRPVVVIAAREARDTAILHFEDCVTREDAEGLRGEILYMNKGDVELDEDTYFIADLIGLEVYDVDTKRHYGVIKDVLQTGANDVYVVFDKEHAREYLVPAIADVVITTDIEDEKMEIRPLRGLFDDAD